VDVVGKALDRDLAPGEQVDAVLDHFIEVRDRQRRKEEGERAEAEAWVESTRRYNAVRDAKLRDAWCEYHQEQAERHKALLADLVRHHEAQAKKLMNGSSEASGATKGA